VRQDGRSQSSHSRRSGSALRDSYRQRRRRCPSPKEDRERDRDRQSERERRETEDEPPKGKSEIYQVLDLIFRHDRIAKISTEGKSGECEEGEGKDRED
jgi:hypothetical protein